MNKKENNSFVTMFSKNNGEIEYSSLNKINNDFKNMNYRNFEKLYFLENIMEEIINMEKTNTFFIMSSNIFLEIFELIENFCKKINWAIKKEIDFNNLIKESFIFINTENVDINIDFFKKISCILHQQNEDDNLGYRILKSIRNKLIHPNSNKYKSIHILTQGTLSTKLSLYDKKVCIDDFFSFSSSFDVDTVDSFWVKRDFFMNALTILFNFLEKENNLNKHVCAFIKNSRKDFKLPNENDVDNFAKKYKDEYYDLYIFYILNKSYKDSFFKQYIYMIYCMKSKLDSLYETEHELMLELNKKIYEFKIKIISELVPNNQQNYAYEKSSYFNIDDWFRNFNIDEKNDIRIEYNKVMLSNYKILNVCNMLTCIFFVKHSWKEECIFLQEEYNSLIK